MIRWIGNLLCSMVVRISRSQEGRDKTVDTQEYLYFLDQTRLGCNVFRVLFTERRVKAKKNSVAKRGRVVHTPALIGCREIAARTDACPRSRALIACFQDFEKC